MPLVAKFGGVQDKLARANTHFQALNGEIQRFLGSQPYTPIAEYDQGRGQFIARARLITDPPNTPFWALLIGDCVHNLRSALDHLANELLKLSGGVPSLGPGGTAFPIFDSSTGRKGRPRAVVIAGDSGAVTGDVLAFVQGVQPYNRLNDAHQHPLWMLSELDNMDKHRSLATTTVAMEDFRISFGPPIQDIGRVHFDQVQFTGPFDETTELARWSVTPRGPNPQMRVDFHGTIDVAFGAGTGPAEGRVALSTLSELIDYVMNIVEVLKVKALRQIGF